MAVSSAFGSRGACADFNAVRRGRLDYRLPEQKHSNPDASKNNHSGGRSEKIGRVCFGSMAARWPRPFLSSYLK